MPPRGDFWFWFGVFLVFCFGFFNLWELVLLLVSLCDGKGLQITFYLQQKSTPQITHNQKPLPTPEKFA